MVIYQYHQFVRAANLGNVFSWDQCCVQNEQDAGFVGEFEWIVVSSEDRVSGDWYSSLLMKKILVDCTASVFGGVLLIGDVSMLLGEDVSDVAGGLLSEGEQLGLEIS